MVKEFRTLAPLFFDVAADVHPLRWERAGLTAEAAGRLTGCARSRRTLSRRLEWIVPGGAALPDNWEGGAEDGVRRALASGDTLWRAAVRLGAARMRGDIGRMVWRDDVSAFKNEFGEDVYLFALRQAPLLLRDGALPDGGETGGGTAADGVRRSAGLALGCWLSGLSAGTAARARLKLSPLCDADIDAAFDWPEERRRAWAGAFVRFLGVA